MVDNSLLHVPRDIGFFCHKFTHKWHLHQLDVIIVIIKREVCISLCCSHFVNPIHTERNLRMTGSSVSVEEVDWVNFGLFLFTGGSE